MLRQEAVQEPPPAPKEVAALSNPKMDGEGRLLQRYGFGFGGGELATLDEPDEGTFEWDGKGSDGKYARPLQSPLRATVEITGEAKSRSDAKESRIEIKEIKIAIAGMDGNKRIVVNGPNTDVEATASIYLKKSDGNGVLTEVPIQAEYFYENPANNNVEKISSFEYAPGNKLGKRSDASAVFWKAATGFTTTSPDSYKAKCVVEAKTAPGPDLGLAMALFNPSGVGGDDYKVAVKVFAADGSTELANAKNRKPSAIRPRAFWWSEGYTF